MCAAAAAICTFSLRCSFSFSRSVGSSSALARVGSAPPWVRWMRPWACRISRSFRIVTWEVWKCRARAPTSTRPSWFNISRISLRRSSFSTGSLKSLAVKCILPLTPKKNESKSYETQAYERCVDLRGRPSMRPRYWPVRLYLVSSFGILLLVQPALLGQASYQAQIHGLVSDASGAVLPNATITITEVGTNVSQTAKTNSSGEDTLRALRPSTYMVRATAPGFQIVEQEGVVLAVDQETTLNFTLHPGGTSTTIQVTEAAPLLDTESSALGTDVTSQYVKEIPLLNRNFFGLVFLNAGVSEAAGSGIADNYPSGTNFVSNGQRNATAEIRMDGALITAPEQGEGGNSNVYYEPSVEAIQEFKVQNNSFSAEFGSNGGTVVNMALKSGTNALHGSAWWFGQNGVLDANDFFSNQAGLPRPDHSRNQYGFSLGGPIRKNKTFFFVDIERVLETDPVNIVATVPTPAERVGDFSQALITDPNSGNIVPNLIFNPHQVDVNGVRAQFPGNKIDKSMWDPIGENILNLYPLPNQSGNPDGTDNFRTNTNSFTKSLQFDAKVDQQFRNNQHLAGRYSHEHASNSTPTVFGDSEFNDGINGITSVENGSLQHDWTIRPALLLSSRFAIDYVYSPSFSQ